DRGVVLRKLKRFEEALASYEQAITLEPEYALAHLNLAHLQLSLGNFEAGWREYEWRGQVRAHVSILNTKSQLIGKRIAILAEQGVGDEIMFGSMLSDLIRDARSVIYQVDPRLTRIFSRGFPSVEFVPRGQPDEIRSRGFDLVMKAGSLGYVYRENSSNFPRVPYLCADATIVSRWKSRLGAPQKFKVGISWRGGSKQMSRARRSIDLDQLVPIFANDSCSFVSLQYGNVSDEIKEF